jgi:hypothetical protein
MGEKYYILSYPLGKIVPLQGQEALCHELLQLIF